MNNNNFFDFINNFQNISNLSGLPKKNFEALNKAGQVMVEAGRTMLNRASEVINETSAEAMNVIKDVMSSQNTDIAASKQQNFIKNCVEASIANAEEMKEIADKSSKEITKLISKCISDNINEACNQNQASTKKKAAS